VPGRRGARPQPSEPVRRHGIYSRDGLATLLPPGREGKRVQTSAFKTWLAQQYTRNSAASRYSCAKRVEEHYGDLDQHYDEDGLASVLQQLAYSLTDAKAN